jgi:hypothetical protein
MCIPPVTKYRTGYVSNVASCRIVVPKIAEKISTYYWIYNGTSGVYLNPQTLISAQ